MEKSRLLTIIYAYGAAVTMVAAVDWPKIHVKDGHLTLTVGRDKNISLFTSGEGSVHVNGEDIGRVAKLARNVTVLTESYGRGAEAYLPSVPEGVKATLFDQVQLLQSDLQNLTAAAATKKAVQRINRRLNFAQRRIRQISLLLRQNECKSNPCQNGGTCQDLFDDFMCLCPAEWEGTTCEVDANECKNFAGTDLGCQNGATCVNKPGGYTCICSAGWNGVHCTKKDTDCTTGGADLCGHGICIPQGTSVGYRCICDQGWQTDGKNPACNVDANECESFPCSKTPLVQCINVPGSFFCGHCPPGYTGNGYHCNDVDECETFNGGCSLNPNVLCINTPGSRRCGPCPPGYAGDGVTCAYSGGACGVNNGGCHPLAGCRHVPGVISTFVECTCPAGYAGNGIGPDGCARRRDSAACDPNPCAHGTCAAANATGYVCACFPGYGGANCDVRADPCDPNPCANGGSCVKTRDSYYCKCTSDFTGFRCDAREAVCGGRLFSYAGTLEYPPKDAGGTYKHNCAWVIETNSTKVLNVTFAKFNIKETGNCAFDWLQIHDGRNSAATSLGRYCGKNLPMNGTVLSTHNSLYIWYRGDSSSSGNGFSLSWTTATPACYEIVSVRSHGVLRSPGFPGNYPNDRDCVWELEAPVDKRMEFHFFTLTIGDDPANCTKDFIAFHSATRASAPFAKYCNTSHPPPLTAPFHKVFVHFHSDESGQYPGFQISYSIVPGIPNCGGVYTEDSDIIQTQLMNTNFQYSMTYECEYKIVVSREMRIKIEFMAFNVIKYGTQCQEQLTIYEGSNAEGPVVGRYCGTALPPPYISLGNELLLLYKSRLSRGFTLKYDAVCGATFTASEGIISSSNYPDFERSRKSCLYQISQPIGTVIILNVAELSTSRGVFTCRFDKIEIRDGDSENAALIGRFCDQIPIEIVSTHNALWIKMSQSLFDRRRYYMNYTTTEIGCGGILRDSMGTIQSPAHPSFYPSKLKCTWMIVAPPNKVVQLSWITFKLENSHECKYDYVEVHDNSTGAIAGGLMGRYCGSKLPPILLSSSNVVTVTFKTDASINQDGFIASYTFISSNSVCGGTYFTPSGVIKSPYYPNSYPVNKDCKWIVHVPSGNQIMLNVSDFQLEPYSSCRFDFLEIRNGGSGASPLIGKFCGSTIPKLIPSHANQLYLHFKSDFTRSGRGFQIFWTSTSTGCGGTLTSARGSIISPHYPEPYDKNAMCVWKISVNAGSTVQLVFADIELENHVLCRLDYVEIFDGFSYASKSLGRFCNSAHPPAIRSTGSRVLVKFRSDISEQGRGFQLQYSTVCNNRLTGYGGVIESPNFPNGYPHNQDCVWEIHVPLGNKINLTFSHFELERSLTGEKRNCEYDYVEISYYDSEEESTKVLDKLCGTGTEIKPMTIPANNTKIHFVTDNLLIGTGFRLEWQLYGCGGFLERPEGIVETTGYPRAYPKNTRCEWIISLPTVGKSVEIAFDQLDLEHSDECDFDYVEVYNGRSAKAERLISRFCTTHNVTRITSSGHEMFVAFESDFSFEGIGFRARYATVNSTCGGSVTAESGFITSPNYPENYDRATSCEWLITVKENHVVNLEFLDVDLAAGCNKTSLRAFDGPGEGYPLLAAVCGGDKPNGTVGSSYNHVYLKFEANAQITAKGFKIKFKTACGAILDSETSGLIRYEAKITYTEGYENCRFTIIAPNPADHVSLVITYIKEDFCEYAFSTLNVYNGYNESDPLIGSYCEKIPPTITSDGAALHISTSASFRASYTTFSSACGGTLEHESGYFSTPNYPNEYPADVECEWTLNISRSLSLSVTFTSFELVRSDFCNEDFVEIRAVDDGNRLLGAFCGDDAPSNVTAVGAVWIYFKSAKGDVGALGQKKKGFMAEYAINRLVELSGPTGLVYSPLYPEFYKKTNSFHWRITVPFGYRIHLTAREFYLEFSTEDVTSVYALCVYGSLTIHDGYDEDAPKEVFCGTERPNFRSSSNVIFVSANFDIVKKGSRFLLEWTQTSRTIQALPTTRALNNTCGSNLTIDVNAAGSYRLESPGYPEGYGRNLHCEWIFSTIPQNHLSLRFTDLRVVGTINCVFDAVSIYSGDDETEWRLIKTACLPNATTESVFASDLMKVAFKTNPHDNATGFAAVVEDRCGGHVRASNGVVRVAESSGGSNSECQWNVTVRSGRTVAILFKSFDLGENKDGTCDSYLILRNGQYSDSPFLGKGKYCGRDAPGKLSTTANHLYVKFKSAARVPGFAFEFKEVSIDCGGKVSLTHLENSTTVSSPNYPNVPQPHAECVWIVRGPPGESLRLDFQERFDLTTDDACRNEYVELRDGGTSLSRLIGKFCGEMPSTQYTIDNVLYLKFFTQTDDPRNGFKATVTLRTCGGVLRESKGRISSPDYGSKEFFPQRVECVWELIGPRDHYLNLTFEELDVTSRYGDCDDVGVEVYDRFLYNDTKYVLVDACRMSPELKSVRTFSNKVTVKFKSGSKRNLARFTLTFRASQEACGGKLTATSGYIRSPGYPIMNHHQRICEWDIEVPKGRRIKVEVLDLDLDTTSHWHEQGMAFFNDHDFYSEIEYLKPGDPNKFVRSTDNVMAIYFWSSHSSTHRGFKLRYTSDEPTVCAGDFSRASGVIRTPENTTIFRCSWHRQDEPDPPRTVVLKLTTNGGERKPTGNCGMAGTNLDVKTKVHGETALVAEYCNFLQTPTILRVPYSQISIVSSQSAKHPALNFTVEYTTQSCGGILTRPFGTIRNPEHPNKPSTTYDCVWVVDLLENQAVKLNFTTTELGTDCEKHFVTVRNGPLKTSPKIGTFCGRNAPTTYVTQSKGAWIEYHFDAAADGKGFEVDYEPVVGGCGGIFYDTNRFLQTPDYPNEYPNDAECVWELRATDGYHIALEFSHRFHLESSSNCENDYVEIYDYVADEWTLLEKICGREAPNFVNSTSTKMKVVFRSNSKTTQAGFRAKWRLNCGGNFIADSTKKVITSPGYPNNYKSNMHCVYNITALKGSVEVQFDDFNLEHGDSDCAFDNVTLSYKIFRSRLTNTYCSTTTPPPVVADGNVVVTFRSDNFLNRRGFKLTYNTDACGGEITEPTEIVSPPKTVKRNARGRYANVCVWNITAPEDKVVVVQIESLSIIYNLFCTANYLSFYEGYKVDSSNRLAKLCGNYTDIDSGSLPVVRSGSNRMTVAYREGFYSRKASFRALVYFSYGPRAGCGGKIYLNDTETTTVRGPASLRELDCHYEIETLDGYYLSLNFEEVDGCVANITGKLLGDCSCSSFEVRDGGGPFSEIIDTFCDRAVTSVYKTTASRAWIRWRTNLFNQGKGFKLGITPTLSTCGPSLLMAETSTKELLSPNYPETYPSDLKCTWKIVLPSKIPCCMLLKFAEFDLGDVPVDSKTCPGDKVSINDKDSAKSNDDSLGSNTIFAIKQNYLIGGIPSAPSGVHQYCGKLGHEYDYYSAHNEVTVDFESFSGNHGKGFRLEYKIDGCSRTLTGQQGRVKARLEDTSCTILITAPSQTTVSIYFLVYYIINRRNCDENKLEVYDGPSNTSEKLATICPNRIPNPVFSTQNVVLVQITKRENTFVQRVDFTYTSTDKGRGCGGKIYNYQGTFTSPMYPQNYPNISDCTWEVNVPYGLDVEITFTQFSIPSRCDIDYLTVTTYVEQNSNEHKYCGSDPPPRLRSSKKLLVRYVTSFHNGAAGWVAQFTAITDRAKSLDVWWTDD